MIRAMIEDDTPPVVLYSQVPEDVGAEVTFRFDDPGWLVVQFVDEGGAVLRELELDTEARTTVGLGEDAFRVEYRPVAGGYGEAGYVFTKPWLPEGQVLRIARATPLQQPESLTPNAPLRAKVVEAALDRLTMALQDERAGNGSVFRNVLVFPPDEPAGFRTQLPAANERAGKLLGFSRQTGEMEMVTTETLSGHEADHLMNALRAQAVSILNAAQTAMNGKFAEAASSFFYRHPTNGGLKFGYVGDHVALGQIENVPGEKSITIQSGMETLTHRAKGKWSVSIGYDTHSEDNQAVSIGSYCQAAGVGSVALGHNVSATQEEAVAIGQGAKAHAPSSVAVGPMAFASGETPEATHSVAVGYKAKASGASSTAAGYEAEASGNGALAVGTGARAPGNHQTSIGHSAGDITNPAAYSLSLGAASKARAANACAVGYGCMAEGVSATAVGVECEAKGASSTAIGYRSSAYGTNSCAYGHDAKVGPGAERSTAIGNGVLLQVPDSVDVRAKANGPRIFLSGRTGAAYLSYTKAVVGTSYTTDTNGDQDWGNEPAGAPNQFHVPKGMLTFHVDQDGKLCVLVSVPSEANPTNYVIKKGELTLHPLLT